MTDDFKTLVARAAENKRKAAATWDAFCERNFADRGFFSEDNERYWTRSQFRLAARLLPKSHPDRWKYVVGSRYGDNLRSRGFEEAFGFIKLMFVIFGSIGLAMATIPMVFYAGLFGLLPLACMGGSFALYFYLRYLALRK